MVTLRSFSCSFFSLILFFFASYPALSALNHEKESWPSILRILAGPSGGSWLEIGTSMSKALSKNLLPTSCRAGGGIANIKDLNKGYGDIAFTLGTALTIAINNKSNDDNYLESQNISFLANLYPETFFFIVRKNFARERNISSVKDLLAQKGNVNFSSLKTGTTSELTLRLLLAYGYNTNYEELENNGWDISFNDYLEIADFLTDGSADCLAFATNIDSPLLKSMNNYAELEILSLEPEVITAMQEKLHFSSTTVTSKEFNLIRTPIHTLQDTVMLVARKDIPDDLAYELMKTLWKERETIRIVAPEFKNTSLEKDSSSGLSMHPGAQAFWNSFYKEK